MYLPKDHHGAMVVGGNYHHFSLNYVLKKGRDPRHTRTIINIIRVFIHTVNPSLIVLYLIFCSCLCFRINIATSKFMQFIICMPFRLSYTKWFTFNSYSMNRKGSLVDSEYCLIYYLLAFFRINNKWSTLLV